MNPPYPAKKHDDMIRFRTIAAAWSAALLLAACESSCPGEKEHFDTGGSAGVFCLCEGNMNAGNASLSYYDPETRSVQNEVFYRANWATWPSRHFCAKDGSSFRWTTRA